MQTQFQYIVDQAKQYQIYSDSPSKLFDAINELPQDVIDEIHKEYADPESRVQPVNLLRAEIARLLMNGTRISEQIIEEIKEHVRQQDEQYFSYLSTEQLKQLKDYPQGKRDIFANWQKHWGILHIFFTVVL